MYKNIL
ncbi:unnamed protein product [Linum tenue]|nr:unnamed protein product [Linum tenue]